MGGRLEIKNNNNIQAGILRLNAPCNDDTDVYYVYNRKSSSSVPRRRFIIDRTAYNIIVFYYLFLSVRSRETRSTTEIIIIGEIIIVRRRYYNYIILSSSSSRCSLSSKSSLQCYIIPVQETRSRASLQYYILYYIILFGNWRDICRGAHRCDSKLSSSFLNCPSRSPRTCPTVRGASTVYRFDRGDEYNIR